MKERVEVSAPGKSETSPQRVPLAFFDIDGTLIKGFTISSFADYLMSHGIFNREFWNQMQADMKAYAKSDRSEESYRRFAIGLVDHYAQGLAGQSLGEIERQGELFFEEVQRGEIEGYRLLDYAAELTGLMKTMGRTIAISGSPIEALLPLKRLLSFDEIRATTLEIEDSCFTSRVVLNLAIDTAKKEVISEYLDQVDFGRSFAFGDSIHDLPILEAVANPFVLGDNLSLQRIGEERGWFVVRDGDEIIVPVRNRIELVLRRGKP